MEHSRPRFTSVVLLLVLVLVPSTSPLSGDSRPVPASANHTIFMTVAKAMGATATDKLEPPPVDPPELSKGYGYRAPGEADKARPQRWEVSSYLFAPGFVTVRQGDTVTLNVFVVNGDAHEVRVLAPDGKVVAPRTLLHPGREYRLTFTVAQSGAYQLACSMHAPTMTATVLVLPR